MKPPDITQHLDLSLLDSYSSENSALTRLRTSNEWAQVREYWELCLPLLNSSEEPQLHEWLKILLLGACAGFVERNLNPNHPAHSFIFPRMIEDVQAMYYELKEQSEDIDAPEITEQVFDFGIQWVYYLDWKVYISQELY